MIFERKTHRLYYQDFLLREAQTRVVRVEKDAIELEATVAYPVGGGQESDHGIIRFENGTTLRFDGAKKLYTHSAGLSEFPGLQVDGVIQHVIVEEDQPQLSRIEQGMSAIVSIDVDRRARLALSHTASHLLYLGIGQIRPDAIKGTIGCHIKMDGARFDFRLRHGLVLKNYFPSNRPPMNTCIEMHPSRSVQISRYLTHDSGTVKAMSFRVEVFISREPD